MQRAWSRRRFLTVSSGLVLGGGLLAACSDDDDEVASTTSVTAQTLPTTTSTSTPTDLPTNDEGELKAMFDPLFEPLDQQVTRIGLYDLSRGFVRDDEGTHMAIYTEPIDPEGAGWDTTRYVESIAPNMQVCNPFIFETWSGIQSMDVCQEPPQADFPEEEPPIVTQVQISRADYNFIDWETVDLTALMAARELSPQTVRVRGDEDIESHPLWIAAEEAAQTS